MIPRILLMLVLAAAAGAAIVCSSREAPPEAAPNGIEFMPGYKDWRVIAVSHRSDNNTLRAILGNDVAIQAARAGDILPWPDGAVMAKIVWRDTVNSHWPAALGPGEFVQVEFMVKDSAAFGSTGGWGFARWVGTDLKVYGEDASFVNECFKCHLPVREHDYVFTQPAIVP